MKLPTNLPVPSHAVEISDRLTKVGGLISIVFGYSPSAHYPMALHLWKSAAAWKQLDDGTDKKKALYVAVFARTKEQAGHAAALLKICRKWKTTQIYTSSRVLADPSQVQEVLECYFQSLSLKDHRAHCWRVFTDYSSFTVDVDIKSLEGTLPCKRLMGWMHRVFDSAQSLKRRGHKIALSEMVKDLAIEKNCDWCPNFTLKS